MKAAVCAVAVMVSVAGYVSPASTATKQTHPPCPSVYGTWRTAYIMDHFGNPQPLAPSPGWEGLIMEARIDKEKAVLVWFGGKKRMTFKRWYKFRQWEGSFIGLNGAKEVIAETDFEEAADYPTDKCYLEVSYYLWRDYVGSLDHNLLMEKVK